MSATNFIKLTGINGGVIVLDGYKIKNIQALEDNNRTTQITLSDGSIIQIKENILQLQFKMRGNKCKKN